MCVQPMVDCSIALAAGLCFGSALRRSGVPSQTIWALCCRKRQHFSASSCLGARGQALPASPVLVSHSLSLSLSLWVSNEMKVQKGFRKTQYSLSCLVVCLSCCCGSPLLGPSVNPFSVLEPHSQVPPFYRASFLGLNDPMPDS